jgi:hypothetical protein
LDQAVENFNNYPHSGARFTLQAHCPEQAIPPVTPQELWDGKWGFMWNGSPEQRAIDCFFWEEPHH